MSIPPFARFARGRVGSRFLMGLLFEGLVVIWPSKY